MTDFHSVWLQAPDHPLSDTFLLPLYDGVRFGGSVDRSSIGSRATYLADSAFWTRFIVCGKTQLLIRLTVTEAGRVNTDSEVGVEMGLFAEALIIAEFWAVVCVLNFPLEAADFVSSSGT